MYVGQDAWERGLGLEDREGSSINFKIVKHLGEQVQPA